ASGGSSFTGSLMLVGNGSGLTDSFTTTTIDPILQVPVITTTYTKVGLLIKANLTTSGAGDLTLVQTGSVNDYGIYVNRATVTAGGALTLVQSGMTRSGISLTGSGLKSGGATSLTQSGAAVDGFIVSGTLTAVGALTLVQSGTATGDYGIGVVGASLTSGGVMSLNQTGSAYGYGILVYGSSMNGAGNLNLSQTGNAAADSISDPLHAIYIGNSRFVTNGDMALLQTGRVLSTGSDAIVLDAVGSPVTFATGITGEVIIRTNNLDLSLHTSDGFVVSSSRLRLDLGRGHLTSHTADAAHPVPAGGYSFKATGSAVYFTGATSGNNATLALGATGSFTYVTDLRANSNTEVGSTDIQLSGFTSGNSSGVTLTGSHLTVKTGIVGQAMVINAPSAAVNQKLSYIEGTSIIVSGASTFSGGLVLNTTSGGSISLGANLTTNGDLAIYGHSGNFTTMASSTIALGSGTEVLIDLGGIGGGQFRDSGNTLTVTGNGKLTVLAGSYSLTAATSINLGSGTFASVIGGGQDFVVTGTALVGTGFGRSGLNYDRTIRNAKGFLALGVDPTASELAKINTTGAKKTSLSGGTNSLVASGDIWIDSALGYDFTSIVSTGGSIHFIGGASSFSGAVTLSAKNFVSYSVAGSDLTLAGDWTVKGSFLRLDVGGSNKILGGRTLNWTGGDVYYTGAAANNAVTLNLGKSNFVFVTDNRATTTDTTIDQDSTMPTAFIAGAGLTITTTGTRNGQGLVYGGTVSLVSIVGEGVTPSAARQLRYIEGTGIAVTTNTSVFTGSLTLVSSGAGITDEQFGNAGILIKTDLTSINRGDLTLVQSGSATRGIYVRNATVTSSGNLTMLQTGLATAAGIVLGNANVTVDYDLSLLQSGKVGDGHAGILLTGIGEPGGSLFGVKLNAGAHSFVTLKTRNERLWLNDGWSIDSEPIAVKGGGLRIDLGTGAMTSTTTDSANSPLPTSGYTILAAGMEVYFTGATSGNIATIDFKTGSFTFVTDLRANGSTTVGNSPLSLTSFTEAASGLSFGSATNETVKTGIVGQAITIAGLTSGANQSLSYIEGDSVT
ncbi:MAG: hypothetical protein ORO03_11260, partial [Alphaproteobacteria bacterium]|nr:hypothetical protein [Alphaproteobacteria bacterium]